MTVRELMKKLGMFHGFTEVIIVGKDGSVIDPENLEVVARQVKRPGFGDNLKNVVKIREKK